MTPHDALILERMAKDASLALIWGGGGLALIAGAQLRQPLMAALDRPIQIAALLATTSTLCLIPSEAAEFSASWHAALRPDILLTVVFKTHAGMSGFIQLATCVLVIGSLAAGWRKLAIGLCGLALAEMATAGHMAESFDLSGLVRIAIAGIHILSAAAWFGALLPFTTLLRLSRDPNLRTDAISAMRLFSHAGHLAVAMVIVTGLANAWLIVGHLPLDWHSAYQRLLLLKIAAVAAMCAIAITGRYIIVPRSRTHPHFAQTALALGAACEIALGLCAFALVASFGLEDPT